MLAAGPEGPTVRCCVRDKDDDSCHPSVALFEQDPTLDSLDIEEPRLGLDSDLIVGLADHGIPCPQVTRQWEWHLGLPRRSRGQSSAKATEESYVRRVADGITARVDAHDKIQTERRREPTDHVDGHARKPPALDPTDGRVRYPGHARDGRLAHAGCHPSQPQFLADGCQGPNREARSSVPRSLTRSHNSRSWQWRITWRSTAPAHDNRRACCTPTRERRGADDTWSSPQPEHAASSVHVRHRIGSRGPIPVRRAPKAPPTAEPVLGLERGAHGDRGDWRFGR